jgi:hypothetical protein
MAIGLISYQDTTTRPEDVKDLVVNADYKSTPFWSAIGESMAHNTLHEWLSDTYATSADESFSEGSAATIVDHTVPARPNNIVQLFRKVISVSDTQQAINHYGMSSAFEYQSGKAFVEMARDMEKAAIAGTKASGASGTARKMDGAIALISTNKTARASGTSLSETEFNDMLQNIYDNGADETVDLVLTGAYLKRVIDRFNTKTTTFQQASDYVQTLRVETYVSAFGEHRIALSREVPSAAGSAGVLAIDSSKWKKAWLVNRQPKVTPLGKTGSNTQALLEAEATVEALNQKSSAYRSGYFVG